MNAPAPASCTHCPSDCEGDVVMNPPVAQASACVVLACATFRKGTQLCFYCAETLCDRAVGAYFKREADSPKLLKMLETQSIRMEGLERVFVLAKQVLERFEQEIDSGEQADQ
jgi:hypothetical protein